MAESRRHSRARRGVTGDSNQCRQMSSAKRTVSRVVKAPCLMKATGLLPPVCFAGGKAGSENGLRRVLSTERNELLITMC